jgi:RNA polymerase sigma factor (sigma-70 family)
MPWTELGPASCIRNAPLAISESIRAISRRQLYQEYLAHSWFVNFIAKPPYEPGDKPRFDGGRFKNVLPRRPSAPVFANDDDENSPGADQRAAIDKQIRARIKQIVGSAPCGAILPATWQGGNKAEPDAKVTRRAKSYEALVSAARPVDADGMPRFNWDPKYNYDWRDGNEEKARKYSYRSDAAWSLYSDIRRHGKARCKPDVTYAQAAHQDSEAFLHRTIDEAAPKRRRQIRRQREAKLWQQERCRHQPRRLLYLLKQPRTWLEARFLMGLLDQLLTTPKSTPRSVPARKSWIRLLGGVYMRSISWQGIERYVRGLPPVGNLPVDINLSADKIVNCVSGGAMNSSKERDGRKPQRRRRVFPTATEELDLARIAKSGDPNARDRLLSAHWPLVHRIAKKHATGPDQLFDLIQEGFVGLTKSFDQFDPERHLRFSTFAMLPVEWAILDYKRRQPKNEIIPLDAVAVENIVHLGTYSEPAAKRTSRSIRNRINRGNITVHISPYVNGLAPETHDFIAELNAEANRLNARVQFIGLKNRIEVTGDIEGAATTASLVAWFLSRAHKRGYFQGEQAVLRRENSRIRKELRKRAKRKPK